MTQEINLKKELSELVNLLKRAYLYEQQNTLSMIETKLSIEPLSGIIDALEKRYTVRSQEIRIAIMDSIRNAYKLINVRDELECFNGKIYVNCEDEIKNQIERLLIYTETMTRQKIRDKIWTNDVNEIINKLKRIYSKAPEEVTTGRYVISFENGLLDVNEFIEKGLIELSAHGPDIYVTHHIPHSIQDLNDFVSKEYGLEAYMDKEINIMDLAEKQTPFYFKVFSEWVDEPVLLFEVIGYTFYKDYPIHKAFMFIGEGNNGKSTYLDLLRHILGNNNVSSISLQDITNNRFSKSRLYRKLANIFPDLPKARLLDEGDFKALTGEDLICADRKFKEPICFTNYAKLIFSANEFPQTDSFSNAFWKRWVIKKFPKSFPPNPRFKKELLGHQELSKLITVSLYALRNVMLKRTFTVKDNEVKEWMRKADSVYAFTLDMTEPCPQSLSPEECKYERKDVYRIYVSYCSENEFKPISKTLFYDKFPKAFEKIHSTKLKQEIEYHKYFSTTIMAYNYCNIRLKIEEIEDS